jgi:hypothetical protein
MLVGVLGAERHYPGAPRLLDFYPLCHYYAWKFQFKRQVHNHSSASLVSDSVCYVPLEFSGNGFFTTKTGEFPSPVNAKPFSGSRGSLVLYSPATFYSVLGQEHSTLTSARKAGGTGLDMTPSEVAELFPLVQH